MARQFATIVVVAFLTLTVTAGRLGAQGRGRGNHPGTNGHPAPPQATFHAAPGAPAAPPPAFVGRPTPPLVAPWNLGGARGGYGYPQRRIVGQQPYIGGYSPYLWSAPISIPTVYADPSYVAPSSTQNEAELAYQVQRLSQEIEQLRREQALAAVSQQLLPSPPPPPPAPSAPELPGPPTVLVFRDGHRQSIQNYAIVGKTLWVLDERASARISLSDLDLDATQKENRGTGTRFPVLEK